MTTAKENFMMAVVEHTIPEWVPNEMSDVIMAGGSFETYENGPFGGGLDGFGVEWHSTASASGQPVPAPGKYVLEDILDWEDVVKFPDLDAFDWQAAADMQLAMGNRDEQVVEYACWNAQFLRMTHLLGFENALISMFLEPEACSALMGAITDYKIGIVERAAKYFKPDFFTNFDDVATEKGLFMSPESYRELIKPHHKRLNDAIKAHDIYPIMHTCGKCEEIVPDFIEEGAIAWSSAQPMNDIVSIQQKYGDQIAVIGGYDSNGRPGMPDATEEEIDAEVKRAIEAYAPQGSFVFMGFRLIESTDPMAFLQAIGPINAAVEKYGRNFYKQA